MKLGVEINRCAQVTHQSFRLKQVGQAGRLSPFPRRVVPTTTQYVMYRPSYISLVLRQYGNSQRVLCRFVLTLQS